MTLETDFTWHTLQLDFLLLNIPVNLKAIFNYLFRVVVSYEFIELEQYLTQAWKPGPKFGLTHLS